MILTDDSTVLLSASDIVLVHTCEYGFLRRADVVLGRAVRERVDDPFKEQLAEQGREHESDTDRRLATEHDQFIVAPHLDHPLTRASLTAATERTRALIEAGYNVISQAPLFCHDVLVCPDYLIRQPDGRYEVWDAKLAHSIKHEAALQLAVAAYVLDALNIPRSATAGVFLGNGSRDTADLDELTDDVHRLIGRARRLFAGHQQTTSQAPWNDDISICGTCDDCASAIELHQDVLLVHRLDRSVRTKLRTAGIRTVRQLAESAGPIDGITPGRLDTLRAQAKLQAQHVVRADGSVDVAYEVFDSSPIANLPDASPADIFFDFEGDTLFTDESGERGIEYLWGLYEGDSRRGTYHHLWAENHVQERKALEEFCDRLASRLAAHPGLHVYHYGSYEVTTLKRLARRHGVRQQQVEQWADSGVFVNLQPVVTKSIRISQPKYGLKYLEPLYSPPRTADVQNARSSMVGFGDYLKLRDSGDTTAADAHKEALIAYNRDDCLSTLGLRDWLLEQLVGRRSAG